MNRARASSRRTQPEDVGTGLQPRSTTAMPRPAGLPSGHTLVQHASTDSHSQLFNVTSSATDSEGIYNNTTSGRGTEPSATSYLEASPSVTTAGKTTEDYARLKEQFYQSYNPEVGIHTAAVLGGILGWLIVYLLYKTKVKKWVIGLVKRKYNQRQQRQKEKDLGEVFSELEDHDLNPDSYLFQCPHLKDLYMPQLMQQSLWQADSVQHHHAGYHPQLQDYCDQGFLERRASDLTSSPKPCQACGTFHEDPASKHQCPMPSIVVDSYSSIPPTEAPGKPQTLVASDPGCVAGGSSSGAKRTRKKLVGGTQAEKGTERKKRYRRRRGQARGRQVPGVRVVDVEEPDTKSLLPPPCSHTDSARATARWVQTMPLLMRSQQDVNGLILQVQPDMLGSQKRSSCPHISNALHFAALPLLGLPGMGWNNSMPALADRPFGSLKDSAETPSENGNGGLDDEDVKLLQPVPCCAARSRSALSHPGCSSLTAPGLPVSPPLSLRSPSPRLSGLLPRQGPVSSSATNLAVPGSGTWMTTSCYSAPVSPVPIPMTPTVTILHTSSSRGSRGGLPRPLHRPDSEASVSSSLSSFDPLTQLQPDCHCDHPLDRPQLQQQQQQQQHQQQQSEPPEADPSAALTSSRASWTVFDDDDEDKVDSCSGVGEGSCGGRKEEGGSRQNSCHSNMSSSSSLIPCGNARRSGPHQTAWTLETKL